MLSDEPQQPMPNGKARLIDAVLSCMAEFGHSGTTVRKIAEIADVTPGLVKHHFGNKEALLVETYRHLNQLALDRIEAAIEANLENVETALDGAIEALFPGDLSDVRQMRVLVAFWGLVLSDQAFADVQAGTNTEMRKLFAGLLRPHSQSTADSYDIADGLIALTDGLWLECCMNPNRMTASKAISIAKRLSRRNISFLSA